MSFSSDSTKYIIGGLAAVAAGVGLWALWRSYNGEPAAAAADDKASASSTTAESKTDKETKKPAKKKSKKGKKGKKKGLTRENLIALFKDISKQMESVVLQLAQMEQQIKSQVGNVPAEEIAKYMMSQFEQAMKAVEAQVYTQYKTTEAEVQELAKEHAEDPEFKAAVGRLQQLYAAISGQTLVTEDVPDSLTKERMMAIMEELFTSMTTAIQEIADAATAANGGEADTAKIQAAMAREYGGRVTAARKAIHSKYSITQGALQAGLVKYQGDEEFAAKMQELTVTQKNTLKRLGLASN